MFISKPLDGHIYLAVRARGRHFLWSVIPVAPTAGDRRIDAARVPKAVRRSAYRLLAGGAS